MRRTIDGVSIALFVVAAALALALVTYNSADPSLNTAASAGTVHNALGPMGAKTADLLLQTFGLASGLLILCFVGWGLRLFRQREITSFWYRLLGLPFCLIVGATFFSSIPAPTVWPLTAGLGGISGDVTLGSLAGFLSFAAPFETALVGLVAGVLTAICFLPACGLSHEEWNVLGRATKFIFTILSTILTFFIGHLVKFLQFLGIEVKDIASKLKSIQLLPDDFFQRLFYKDEKKSEDDDEDADEEDEDEESEEDTDEDEEEESEDDEDEEDEDEDEEESSGPRLDIKRAKRGDEDVNAFVVPQKSANKNKKRDLKQGRLKLSNSDFDLPPLDILQWQDQSKHTELNQEALKQNAQLLESVLQDFGVNGKIVKIRPGPVVTLYELEPAPGIKSSRVIGLSDDIARSMSAVSVRVAVVPGQNVIGIELPNKKRETVYLRELLETDDYEKSKGALALVLGKDIGGESVVVDLARMPHLLIAGTTGSGKSVGINTMILSILYKMTPQQCRLIMIDPKMLELSVYDDIPHLLAPVVTDPKKAVVALKWAVKEMENRYRSMSKLGVRNIEGYNVRIQEAIKKGEVLKRRVQTGFEAETGKPMYEDQELDLKPLPYIVVIVDEMADLMLVAGKDIEATIQRLAQMARAAGIHLIMATQRPSVDVITGTIKANFPTRISFQVTSKIDSRTILGEQGAETLLGQGDMLYMAGGGRITRVHGPFASDKEVEEVVKFLKAQAEPEYDEDVTTDDSSEGGIGGEGLGESGDELYQQAVQVVLQERKASTSFVQRRLQIGYNRAARMIEQMEADGLITQPNATGRREVVG